MAARAHRRSLPPLLSPSAAVAAAIRRPSLAAIRELNSLVGVRHWDAERAARIAKRNAAVAEVLNAIATDGGAVRYNTAHAERMRKAVVSGVTFLWPVTPAGLDAAAQTLAALANIRLPRLLLTATERVILTTQRNEFDGTWAKLYGMPGLVSEASGGSGTIVGYHGEPLAPDIFAHEAGHNLASHIWDDVSPDPASEYGRAQSHEPPVSAYGRVNVSEDFAEAVRLFVDKHTGRHKLREHYPRKHAALQNLLT